MSLVATTPLWATDSAVPCIAEPPQAADVVVVGAGLAGIATALFLAQAGSTPVVVDARGTVGASVSGRRTGIVLPLLADTPHRLLAAVGAKTARDIVRFAQRGIDLLRSLDLLDTTGALMAAALPQERAGHEKDRDAMAVLGITSEAWTAEQVAARTGAADFGRGIWVPSGGRLQPGSATEALAHQAVAAGARIVLNTAVTAVRSDPHGMCVQTTGGDVHCDVVVIAANARAAAVDPWFEDKIYPVRTQLVSWAPTQTPLPFPIRTQLGYATLESHTDGSLVASGCRWATPHLEVGEADDTALSAEVHDKICTLAARHAPDRSAGTHSHAWSGIMGFSCDGLPIIGPIPGRSRVICNLGFGGHQATLGLAAARAVADGLTHGHDGGVPALCTARRFI